MLRQSRHGPVAAVTMVRDDAFFLQRWVAHYGALFGRRNLYVINHGGGRVVPEIAMGCNVISVPLNDPHKLEMHRWRSLNAMASMLRQWYRHVIVGDVDELVVVDPAEGTDLAGFLEGIGRTGVLTPFGLEVVHLPDEEPDPIGGRILGPRRHVRMAMHYAKPCILSKPAKLARGGHYSDYPKLDMPDCLYLLHLKYCDRDVFAQVADARNAATADLGGAERRGRGSTTGGHWLKAARDDDGIYEAFARMPRVDGIDFDDVRAGMRESWRRRKGANEFWEYDRFPAETLHRVPDRFAGLV